MSTFTIHGFQEVVIFTRSFVPWEILFLAHDEWVVEAKYEMDRVQKEHWKLDPAWQVEAMLIAHPNHKKGSIRFLKMPNGIGENIRQHSQCWDTGGIYDIDMRIKNIEQKSLEMQSLGFYGFSPIKKYEFGEFLVSEILLKGPEEVVLALIERHQPELKNWPHFNGIGHVFNSSQIVDDLDATVAFYQSVLNFKVYRSYVLEGTDDDGKNLFGLPKNIYKNLTRKITILSPDGGNAGSVEFIELVGLDGHDFSARAIPPNLGQMMLRFPVDNLSELEKRLIQNDVEIYQKGEITLAGIGPVKEMIARVINGVLLGFYELH